MKTINVSRKKTDIEALLNAAQKERVVVTRNGKPSAVVVGIENYDEEDLQLAGSEQFWRLIESRRQTPSVPLSELKERLGLTPSRSSPREASKAKNPPRKAKRTQKNR